MKKLIILNIFTIISMCNVFAQTENNTVTLTTEQYNILPVDVKNKIEASKKIDSTVENLSKWAGLGKEIGEGVNGALMAIEGSATRISETNVGKTAIFIVLWKFIGTDILQLLIGVLIIGIGAPILVNLIRKNRPRKELISKKFIKEKLQFEKEYEMVEGNPENIGWYIFALFILFGIACVIIFA